MNVREREREREGERERGREREQRHYILQDNILKMYSRQTRQVVSRQYITSTKH